MCLRNLNLSELSEKNLRRTVLSSLSNLPFYVMSICHGLDPSSKSHSLQSCLSWAISVRSFPLDEVSFARMPLSISKRSYMPCWLDYEMDPLTVEATAFAQNPIHQNLHGSKSIWGVRVSKMDWNFRWSLVTTPIQRMCCRSLNTWSPCSSQAMQDPTWVLWKENDLSQYCLGVGMGIKLVC